MAAVKNTLQTPPTFDLRELVNFNGPQDKKGGCGDITTKFWDLLNKIDEEDQGSSSPKSAPVMKERLIQEKPSLSSSSLDLNKVGNDPSAEITMQDGNGKKKSLTMSEISVLNQHQPALAQSSLNQNQGSGEKVLAQDGGKNDRCLLKNGLYEDAKLKGSIDEEGSAINSHHKMGDALLNVGKSSQQKVQIEVMPKPMDTTPLAMRAEKFPNESLKDKDSLGSFDEDVGGGQEKNSLTSLTSAHQTTSKSKATHAPGQEEARHDVQNSLSNPPAVVMQNIPTFKNTVSSNSGFEGNKVSGIGQNMSLSGQKILEQKADGVTPMAPKTLSMADKIKALNQIRSELKATLEKGETHLKIQLVPDELGKIEIKLDIDRHGAVQAMFMADNRETMEHIAKYGHEFVQIFHDSGLQTDLNSMNFQSRQHHQEEAPSRPIQEFGVPQEASPITRRVSTTQIDIEV